MLSTFVRLPRMLIWSSLCKLGYFDWILQDDALFTDRLATALVIRTLFDNRSHNATNNAIIVGLALFKTPNHKDFAFNRIYGSNDRVNAHAYRPIHLWKSTCSIMSIFIYYVSAFLLWSERCLMHNVHSFQRHKRHRHRPAEGRHQSMSSSRKEHRTERLQRFAQVQDRNNEGTHYILRNLPWLC